MKVCKRCFREFDEAESVDHSPARKLGDIFISSVGNIDVQELCPECREELGVMNLLGLGNSMCELLPVILIFNLPFYATSKL